MPKIFITGLSGFQASAATDYYNSLGWEVGGLERFKANQDLRPYAGKAKAYWGDLRDISSLRVALRDFNPDYIYHLAAITPVSYSFWHWDEVLDVNFKGTVNLAEAAREVLPNLKKFLFASTMETYGVQEKRGPFTELTPQQPNAPYAVAKVAAEKYLMHLYYAYKFPTLIFRQTNVFGRKHNDYFVVESIITKMLDNPDEINLGRKEPVRNFIYIDDIIELEHYGLVSDATGEVFNTGPDNGLSIEELVGLIAGKMGWHGKINWDTMESRPGEIYYLNSTDSKARFAFDWSPRYTLESGLDETISYWTRKKLRS